MEKTAFRKTKFELVQSGEQDQNEVETITSAVTSTVNTDTV